MPRLVHPGRIAKARLGRRSWLAACAAIAGGCLVPRLVPAAARDEADTSPRAREEAVAALPLSQLTAERRAAVDLPFRWTSSASADPRGENVGSAWVGARD